MNRMAAQAGKKNATGWIIAGLLLGIFIASIDNTIVATSIATIVGDLGGFDQFVWVTSAYLVASLAGTPIFGKLSDMYGRKRFFYIRSDYVYARFDSVRYSTVDCAA